MPVARMTSKGQVTLPKAIREALGIARGDLLVFARLPDGSIVLRRLPGRTLSQLHGSVPTPRSVPHAQERAAYRRALAGRPAPGRETK